MSRLIDADLIQYEPMLSPKGNGQYEEVSVAYKSQINDLPTIERKKGKWIKGIGENGVTTSLFCSCCYYENPHWDDWNFCPGCGADMRGET